jgi:hypothetical protein
MAGESHDVSENKLVAPVVDHDGSGESEEVVNSIEKAGLKRNTRDISFIFSKMSHFGRNERFVVSPLLCWRYATVGGKNSFASDCRFGREIRDRSKKNKAGRSEKESRVKVGKSE